MGTLGEGGVSDPNIFVVTKVVTLAPMTSVAVNRRRLSRDTVCYHRRAVKALRATIKDIVVRSEQHRQRRRWSE